MLMEEEGNFQNCFNKRGIREDLLSQEKEKMGAENNYASKVEDKIGIVMVRLAYRCNCISNW